MRKLPASTPPGATLCYRDKPPRRKPTCLPVWQCYAESMVRFSFAGAEFAALSPGALAWPARRALLVADLHLEKASFFAASGQMLPPYDSHATLVELAALVEATGAEE